MILKATMYKVLEAKRIGRVVGAAIQRQQTIMQPSNIYIYVGVLQTSENRTYLDGASEFGQDRAPYYRSKDNYA